MSSRPTIIQAPSEDPREVAIRSLQAVLDHDPNLTIEDQVFCKRAIWSCRYSMRTDRSTGRDRCGQGGGIMSSNNPLAQSPKVSRDEIIRAIRGLLCSRCPVGTECRGKSKEEQLGALIMCIYHGPADYCDEDYFTAVPIYGDHRFMGLRNRDQEEP